MNDLDVRIREANDEFISDEPEENIQSVDVLQAQRDVSRNYSKKQFPRGSSARVKAAICDVVDGAGTASLGRAHQRAKDDSEALKEAGEYRRAQLVVNQYMQEKFLPAVELVINLASPDELLNSAEGLRELDKYAIGAGSMTGYTAAYIREAYKNALGQAPSQSDPTIQRMVRRLNGLLDTDQIRAAKSLAFKVKKKIDSGENIASEQDYDMVSRIATGA